MDPAVATDRHRVATTARGERERAGQGDVDDQGSHRRHLILLRNHCVARHRKFRLAKFVLRAPSRWR
jgi:hypothetical protein